MATVPPPAPTLPCKECGFINEPERVYCHNCGAKLDRSLLPKEDQLRREAPDKARKRIIKMTNPGDSAAKRWIVSSLKAILYGAVAASLILIARAPADVPPEKPELSSRFVNTEISELIKNTTQPKAIAFTQGELNAFLASGKVKSEPVIPGVAYKRTFVNIQNGTFRTTIQKDFWGYPLYVGTLTHAEANKGVFVGTNVGGNIGRLAIHPAVMQYLAPYLFKDLAAGLKPETDLIRKAFYLHLEAAKQTQPARMIIATDGKPR